jgi:energy-coupling factor transporter ATP-binding protein EcfA2
MNPGERSVQIGRDAIGNVLLTGDRNVVLVVQTGRILEPEERVPAPPSSFGPNPYKGLASFREEDADRFFGRERLTEDLWKALRDLRDGQDTEPPVRLLAVLGPSGSGKSSLVRAGLLPELARRPLTGLENLRVAIVAPGAHPVDALALVLARLVATDPAPVAKAREFSDELERRNQPGDLDGLRRIAGDTPLLVLVDQFEELYTLASAAERKVFIGNLLHAASDRGGVVSVVLTLRTDFLAQSQENEDLHEIIARQSLIVPFLSEEGLRRAVTEPARRAGHPLDEGTIELLIGETRGRDGALPLLQFTLSRIWEGMARGVPAAQTYQVLGGVGGSLAQEARRLYESLSENDQRIARRAFLRMIRVGPDIKNTARRVDLAEVVAHGDDRERVRAVLERFARPEARIITLAAEPDGTITARLTHEALLDRWKQFDEWLTPQASEDLLFHYRLEEEARYWNRRGQPADLLWPKNDLERLRVYERRNSREVTDLQQAFCSASNQRAPFGESAAQPFWVVLFKTEIRIATALVAALFVGTLASYNWLFVARLKQLQQPRISPDFTLRCLDSEPECFNQFQQQMNLRFRGDTDLHDLLERRVCLLKYGDDEGYSLLCWLNE